MPKNQEKMVTMIETMMESATTMASKQNNRIMKNGMKSIVKGILLLGAGTAMLTGCTWDKVQPEVCFEGEVLPIFVTYCTTSGCHNSVNHVEGYDLTTYAGIMEGIQPKHVSGSKLIEAMTGFGEERMPPSSSPQPTSGQIETIKAWVRLGAPNTTNCMTVSCDTTVAVSYGNDLAPMFATYCNGCHGGGSPSAGLNLSDFGTVKQNATTGRIQGSMSGDPNLATMPPSGNLLSSCYVDKLNRWIAAGGPDN